MTAAKPVLAQIIFPERGRQKNCTGGKIEKTCPIFATFLFFGPPVKGQTEPVRLWKSYLLFFKLFGFTIRAEGDT
jgi:hypothetical protein